MARRENLMRSILRRAGDEGYLLIVWSSWGRCQRKKWKAASSFGTRVLPSLPLAAVVTRIMKKLLGGVVMNWLRCFVTLACMLLVAPALAQDISSGPTKGDKAPTLKVY